MGVMAEKVSLLERLQDQEHLLVQLASETETIGRPYPLRCHDECITFDL